MNREAQASQDSPASREDSLWKRRLAETKETAIPFSPGEALAFAEFALNRVSRTFALNIKVLPRPLRDQVLHAYLYCRMADTIEDDPALPPSEKRLLLNAFAGLFNSPDADFAAFPPLLPDSWRHSEDWEKILLARAPVVLGAFRAFPAEPRAAIARCVTEMCAGMADFAANKKIETVDRLDRYCYYVAGTVGIMLCDLFIDFAKIPAARAARMRALCVSFGLGLQLTNILKDLRDDSERGVSWLPADLLAAEGLTPSVFFLPANRAAARRVCARLFDKTRAHLEEALEYTCVIPRFQRRLRLFCLWPLFMAAETLALLANNTDALLDGVRVKITRARVARILLRTRFLYLSNALLRNEFHAALPPQPPTGYL
jgi:farnesyl-diphosphate farnesyltransferase